MISEPEMAGEDGTFGAPAPPDVLDLGEQPPPPVRERRTWAPWRRWLWALGGAVAASAVWGAVLVAYQPGDRAPELHGYRLDKDPCPGIRLKAIGAAVAPREPGGSMSPSMLRHPVLDRVHCYISLREKDGRTDRDGADHYGVGVEIALHKKTDPREEFEAQRNATGLGVEPGTEVEIVPDLGEKAYLLTLPDGDTELRVLDGGAVLTLRLSSFFVYAGDTAEASVAVDDDGDDEAAEPSLTAYQSALISDMRDLMTSLKH
ncbi:hypothetical protein ACWCXC_12870 [Streptomyces sp. NPDC001515]